MRQRSANGWLDLSWDAWRLGLEASSVITLRSLRIAAGGAEAQSEARLMFTEKVEAALHLQAMAATGALGFSAPDASALAIAHYRRKVRANGRRLRKS